MRQIGRRGAGRGEYEAIRNVLVGRDGSVHDMDPQRPSSATSRLKIGFRTIIRCAAFTRC